VIVASRGIGGRGRLSRLEYISRLLERPGVVSSTPIDKHMAGYSRYSYHIGCGAMVGVIDEVSING
jgi:hypothetical protein